LPALWVAQRGCEARGAALRLAAALAVLLLVAAAGLLALAHIDAPLAAPLATLAAGTAAVTLLRQRWQLHERLRLEQARAVAAAASEAKTAFLANVSHEIRTPLNAVLGAAELLSATPLNERQRQHVVVFRQVGKTLSDLINDLLDITKIEAGKLDLHAEAFALRPLLEHQLAMLRARAEQKGLTLELTIAAGLPEAVLADRRRLQQALTNLVGNAIKFTSRGSVRLEVQPVDGNRVRFVVSDTGIGIAASKLEAIFEPFVQADGSITRSYGGTGLGLAITRTVAQLMGGSVQVQSEPGRGSVFTLELPLPATELPPAVPATFSATLSAASVDPAPDAAGRPRRARVLLAEDNEVNVYIFTAMLEGLGLEIDQVGNGIAALEMARQRRYALIFMDVQMPGMDGLQATAALRQHEANEGLPRTPVVALTAHSYADDVQRCLQAGCDRHLAKPFTRADIVGLLEQWLPPDVVDAGAQGIEFAPPAAPGPLDNTAALARLGGDTDRHRRALDHAAVFVAGWAQDFDAAPARRLALAQDLAAIAGSVGAAELEAAALKLQAALQAPSGDDSAASLKAVRQAIAPVLLALAPGRSG
jgi:signal transduction histidine kinase/CheY-like chemotaxis protein